MFSYEIPTRFVIATMICLNSIIAYIVLGSMSVAIVAMTEPIYDATVPPDYGPRYKWSSYDQSLVLGSFFWGYTIVGIVAGILAERFGPRNVSSSCILLLVLTSSLTPVAANYIWLLITVRFLSGIAVGTMLSSSQALIATWAPPEEKGRFLSLYLSTSIGTVIDWSLSGIIIAKYGWHFAFYMVAIASALFGIAWYCTVFDSPRTHPRITDTEKEFLLSKINTISKRKTWPPVRSILTSIPFWALAISFFGCLWGLFFFTTTTPKYLTDVHNLDITIIGLLSSIPYVVKFTAAILFGMIGDWLLKNTTLSPTAIRKWFTLCSNFLPGIFFIGLMFAGNHPYICVALITLAVGCNGSVAVTVVQNPHDLAPNFASTIYGWLFTFTSTSGFIAPTLVAHFTKERSTDAEWFYIFLISAAISIGSGIVFILFGSGNTQEWNNLKSDDEVEETVLEIVKE